MSIKGNGGIQMLSKEKILSILSEKRSIYENKYGVSKIGIFGSYAVNKQKSTSDIDVIVEFKDGFITFDNYMELKFDIEDTFEKNVDLVILQDIKDSLKSNILRDVQYATGA